MNTGRTRRVPARCCLGLAALSILLAGCTGMPDIDAADDPLVVTEDAGVSPDAGRSQARAAAIAEMRARAAAGDAAAFPEVFQSEQSARLAARPEPRPVGGVYAIQAELTELARRRQAAQSAAEIAELDRRAAELRRLAEQAGAGGLRP